MELYLCSINHHGYFHAMQRFTINKTQIIQRITNLNKIIHSKKETHNELLTLITSGLGASK